MNLEEKLHAMNALLEAFRPERYLNLGLAFATALIILLVFSRNLFMGDLSWAEAAAIFGSSGLGTVSTGRILSMWNQAFKVVFDEEQS